MPILRLAAALAVTALVLVATVVLPSPASATPAFYEVEYTVDVDVTASWSITKKDVDDYPKRTFGGDVKARFHGQVENVLFRNGQLLPVQPTGLIDLDSPDGTGFTSVTTWDPVKQTEVTTNGTCGVASWVTGATSYVRRAAAQPNPNAERLTWRLTSALPVGFTCSQAFETGADLSNSASAFPGGAMDTTFELPLEAIGMGKIIQNVSAASSQRTPEFCPGKDQHTDGCAFSWTGKLTFNKVGEWQYAGDLPSAPIDPRAEAIANAVDQYGKDEPVDPRADAISKAVEQYGKEQAFDPRADAISKAVEQYGKELRFTAVCQSGCTGTAEILPRAGRKPLTARAAAARKALAKLKFKVRAGKPRQIRLKLPPKARAALKRIGGANVKITLRPKTGRPKTLTLALKPRRR